MRIWACKMLHRYFFPIRQQYLLFFEKVFSIAGIIFTVGEFESAVFESEKIFSLIRNHYFLLCLLCLLLSAIICRKPSKYTVFLGEKDTRITIAFGDIFSTWSEKKGIKHAVVIPTNSTFDTDMNDDFISSSSVQGQFQKKILSQQPQNLG